MPASDALAATGHALDALASTVAALGAHYGESTDLHRLREDVARIGVDLELLRESTPGLVEAPVPVPGGGSGYDPAFLADGDGDGDVPPP